MKAVPRLRALIAAPLTGLALLTAVANPTTAGASAPTVATHPIAAPSGITTPGPLAQLTSSKSEVTPTESSAQSTSATPNAAPAATSGPQLSIAVDNGRKSAAFGESLKYVLTITNLGSVEVKGLRVTQSVPGGLTLVEADGGGRLKSGSIGWNVDLKAARAVTFHVTMRVSATPKDLLRVATVACASLPAGPAPIVCASHSDRLPAGAAAAAAAASSVAVSGAGNPDVALASGPRASGWHRTVWLLIPAVIIVLFVAVFIQRRRRSASVVVK